MRNHVLNISKRYTDPVWVDKATAGPGRAGKFAFDVKKIIVAHTMFCMWNIPYSRRQEIICSYSKDSPCYIPFSTILPNAFLCLNVIIILRNIFKIQVN